MDTEVQKLIDSLEEKIAFQEDTIQKLDEAMASQQKQLLDAELKIKLLYEQLKKLESNQPEAPQDEKPPHY